MNLPDRPVEIYRSFDAAFATAWENYDDWAMEAAMKAIIRAVLDAASKAAWKAASDAVSHFTREAAFEAAFNAASHGDWYAAGETGMEASLGVATAREGLSPGSSPNYFFDFRQKTSYDVAWAVVCVNSTTNSPEHDRFCAVWMPFVDAIEAGLFYY